MSHELTLYALAALIAGISKGGFGGGVGFVATPLLAVTFAPAQAAAVMLPVLILIDQVGIFAYWRQWRWALVWPVLIAAAVGIALGVAAFGAVDPDLLRIGLGVIAISFLIFQIARARGWTPPSGGRRGARAAIWGATCGFTSTISHAGGPPVTIYLLGEQVGKTVFQASTVLIFWSVNLMKLGPYAAVGVFSGESLLLSLAMAPAAILGVLIGVWAHKRAPEGVYLKAMSVLLAATGAKLLWDGATGLLGG
ncbi:MAG: sulfite exporter TauE/SafE family protein [Pseudomonadota bacterium]